MNAHDLALLAAGVLGGGGAIVHGLLVQRFMIGPPADGGLSPGEAAKRRMLTLLLHFTTFSWLTGGVALIAVVWLDPAVRLTVAGLVGASYLFAALGNFWATRGRHPGWVVYAAATGLLVFGVS